ncbi:MAG: hypothetical protein RL441_172 [Actinomycetota bacterium]|jgi:hypothetical protein
MQEVTRLLVLKAAFGGLCRETPFHGNEMTKPPREAGAFLHEKRGGHTEAA